MNMSKKNEKQLNKGNGVTEKKVIFKSNLSTGKTDTKKSTIDRCKYKILILVNAKQITIHLFNKTVNNDLKSTPMMSFKSVGEDKEKEIVKVGTLKEVIKGKNELYSPNKQTFSASNKPKINKKINYTRKSIAGKEDIYPNFKLNFTPEAKNSIGSATGFKKKTTGEIRHRSQNFTQVHPLKNEQYINNYFQNLTNPSPTSNLIKSSNTLNSNYILTTNYSENNFNRDIREEEFVVQTPKLSTPKNNQIEVQSEIVSSIKTFGTILKNQNDPMHLNELMSNPLEMNKLNSLNNLLYKVDLNSFSELKTTNEVKEKDVKIEQADPFLKFHLNDSKNLLMENNVIRRDTFIDTNFNKKMISNDKNVIINEIYGNSNNRIKKYEILFDFINSNIKEITELMSQNNTIIKPTEEENVIFNKEIVKDLNEEKLLCNKPNKQIINDESYSFINSSASDFDFYKQLTDETITNDNFSNDMSTLRGKIDITQTNDKLDKTQYQYDDCAFRRRTRIKTDACIENNTTIRINEFDINCKEESIIQDNK
jgi:hypothetical protein